MTSNAILNELNTLDGELLPERLAFGWFDGAIKSVLSVFPDPKPYDHFRPAVGLNGADQNGDGSGLSDLLPGGSSSTDHSGLGGDGSLGGSAYTADSF